MRVRTALAVCLPMALVAVNGCGGSNRGTGKDGPARYATKATFTIASADDPGSFDPYRTQFIQNYYLAYDSLVNQRTDGSFVSGLAEKWTADARTATFTLKADITCSDGTRLTASHVADAINYVADPKNGSPRYGFLVPKAPLAVTGDDATRTVRVVMKKEPFGFLLHTLGQLPIVCPNGLKNPNLLKSGSDGTGPFVLSKVTPGQSYEFMVRKDYTWGPGGAKTDVPGTPGKVVIRIIGNPTTTTNLLLAGEVNFASITGQDDQERLAAQRLKSISRPNAGAWIWFNHLGGRPTADKQVRQALMHALNLDQMVKVAAQGGGGPATGLVAKEPRPCLGNSVAGQLPQHDMAAAGTLLDQAGWTKGADGTRTKNGKPLSLDLHYLTTAPDKPTTELIAQQWKPLGVKVKITPDTATGLTHVMFQTSDWDVYMTGFGYVLPTQAVPYASGPVPPKGINVSGINNKEYNDLVEKASGMVPPEACTYWDKAEKALYRDVDIAPISYRTYPYYLKNAEAQVSADRAPIPTSIRVLARTR